jgi:hypothetical protein
MLQMKAKLTRDFTCYPPENPAVKTTFRKGKTVYGEVARWALAEGRDAAVEIKPKAPKKKSAGAAPENK